MSGLVVAICFHDYIFDDISTYFKTVAQNRGVSVEFFSDLDKATKWLGVGTGEIAVRSG